MAIEYVQHSAATATTGALIAADLLDFGTATGVSVQVIKFGYGTDGVYNEVATGQGVPIATGPIYNVQQMTTSTSPVNVTTWSATAFVSVLQGTTVTIPVSMSSAATIPVTVATTPVFNIQQMSSATSPVNVTTWSATAFVSVLQGTTVTIPVSMSSAATIPVILANTSTVNIANTATVQAIQTTATNLNVRVTQNTRGTGTQVYLNVSGTGLTTMATAGGSNIFRDMAFLSLSNAATTTALLRIFSASNASATMMVWALAGDGGGVAWTSMDALEQTSANLSWCCQLATQISGQVHITAAFEHVT